MHFFAEHQADGEDYALSFNNGSIIWNGRFFTIFYFYENISCSGVFDYYIDLLPMTSSTIISHRGCLLIIKCSHMLINSCFYYFPISTGSLSNESSISTAFRIAASAI